MINIFPGEMVIITGDTSPSTKEERVFIQVRTGEFVRGIMTNDAGMDNACTIASVVLEQMRDLIQKG